MNDRALHVLLIEDNPGDAELIEEYLGAPGDGAFTVERAERLSTGLARLARGDIAIVLLDLSLPDSHGMDTFRRARSQAPDVPIVVMSGSTDVVLGLQAVEEGAQDYLVKGQVDRPLLARALHYAVERQQKEAALRRTAAELEAKAASEHRALDELRQAHAALQTAQMQLVQSEKLSALGEMIAGIAHEINNPLAFISNNLEVLQRDLQPLLRLVKLYQQADATLERVEPELLAQVRTIAADMDLPYVLDGVTSLVSRTQDGLKRIHGIVRDLRDFGRLSDAERLAVDINIGIESTLNILQVRAQRDNIHLERDLAPLPTIACFPAKINQLVLNLVSNALDACQPDGAVTVCTRPQADGVEIHVLDTGCGIDPSIRAKIFDPFFTTKPPRQGTGLGLSISYQIVKDHHGRIDFESAPGQGTHFTVFLPKRNG